MQGAGACLQQGLVARAGRETMRWRGLGPDGALRFCRRGDFSALFADPSINRPADTTDRIQPACIP